MRTHEALPAIFLREEAVFRCRRHTVPEKPACHSGKTACVSGRNGIFATGGIFIFSSYSNNKTPLTFFVVDSPMGVGKSQCLMDHIRFSASCHPPGVMNERYIIFVPTLRERDKRFRKKLGVKTPEDRPYSQSIRDMILNGDNIITTHALWSFFNDDTIKAFKQSKYSYAAYFDEVPGLFRDVVGAGLKPDENGSVVRFGAADVKLMQEQKMVVCRNGVIHYNPACEYEKEISDYKVFNAVRSLSRSCTLYPYGEQDGKFTSIVAFAKRELFQCFRQCWFFSYMTHNSMLHKYCLLNHINMEYYHVDGDRFVRNPEGRYIETYPEGIENLVILDDSRFNVDFSLSKNWYERAKAEDKPELEFDNDNYALSELVQFVWRSHVRVKDAHQPVYVWVPDGRMRKLLQEFQQRALERKG